MVNVCRKKEIDDLLMVLMQDLENGATSEDDRQSNSSKDSDQPSGSASGSEDEDEDDDSDFDVVISSSPPRCLIVCFLVDMLQTF